MTLTVNGAPAPLPSPATVAALVATLPVAGERDRAGRGIAVALNGEVVPRSTWAATHVAPGDRVEILAAAQGG